LIEAVDYLDRVMHDGDPDAVMQFSHKNRADEDAEQYSDRENPFRRTP